MRNAECGMRNDESAGGARLRLAQSSVLSPQSFAPRAFSLAELMIAIVILGLGLLVAAAMFPIAWGKARDLAEHTTVEGVTAAAEAAVKLALRVDSAADCTNYTSFAGDYVAETSNAYESPFFMSSSDTWVHPLTVENILITPHPSRPSPILPEPNWILSQVVRKSLGYDLSVSYVLQPDDPNLLTVCPNGGLNDSTGAPVGWYAKPQILFQERVFPPVGPWVDPTTGAQEAARWNSLVDTRVYGWTAFHKLNEPIAHPICAPPCASGTQQMADFLAARKEAAIRPRVFTMYYVTLRRGVGQRFACQDESQFAADPPVIKAHPHQPSNPTDSKFPAPWLVPLKTPDPIASPPELNLRLDPTSNNVPRGVPTEVTLEVNDQDDDFRQFFPVGAQFIDHVNGEVYRVVNRRFDDSAVPKKAFLTLDREIFIEDTRDPIREPNPPYNELPPTAGNENRNRYVWVFPPSIEARSTPNDPVLVEGRSPVVDIVVRSLTIQPQ